VLLLHWQGKAINDASKDLKELPYAIVALCLKDEPVEHIVDGLADEWPVYHELAIDAVEHGLEILALTRILGVKEVEEAEDEGVVHIPLGDLGVGVGRNNVSEEEVIDELEVWPGGVEVWLLLVVGRGAGVDRGGGLVQRGWQRAEDVGRDGGDEGLLDVVREARLRVGARGLSRSLHVIDELEERLAFGLLLPRVLERVREVEDRGDEAELAEEEARAVCGGDVAEERERLEEWRRRRPSRLVGHERGRRDVRRGGRGRRRPCAPGGVVDGDGRGAPRAAAAAAPGGRRGRCGARGGLRAVPARALAVPPLDDLVEHGGSGGGSADRSGDELPPRSSLRDLGIWW